MPIRFRVKLYVALVAAGALLLAWGARARWRERGTPRPSSMRVGARSARSAAESAAAGQTSAPSLVAAVLPPLRNDLVDRSRMPAPVVSALLQLEKRLFTRLDAKSSADFVCDEAMPALLLLAADIRPIGVGSSERDGTVVRLEITSVARSSFVNFTGCNLDAVDLIPSVHVDTAQLYVRHENGQMDASGSTDLQVDDRITALVGPLQGIAKADWIGLGLQADSIRLAHGQPLARPFPEERGHHNPSLGRGLFYPAFGDAGCPATAARPESPAAPELGFLPVGRPNLTPLNGTWFAIYEARDGGCIAPVAMRSAQIEHQPYSCSNTEVGARWIVSHDTLPGRPMLLVRNVDRLRVGPMPQLLTLVTGYTWTETIQQSGWPRADGDMIFGDSGQLLQVVEVPADSTGQGASGNYSLRAWYRGRQYPLERVQAAAESSWSVYWAGYLNDDDVPDLVVRVTRQQPEFRDHRLVLFLSGPGSETSLWQRTAEIRVPECI
jgi:hypothetical protein